MPISSSAAPTRTTAAPPPASSTPTVPDPVLQDQQCYGADVLGKHSDIAGGPQNSWAGTFCQQYAQTFTSTTAPIKWNAGSIIYRDGVSP